jgi:hypothetical protein
MENGCFFADFGVDGNGFTEQESFVTTCVADDFDFRSHFSVALDQSADCGGEAGGQTARSENGNFLNVLHVSNPFRIGLKIKRHMMGTLLCKARKKNVSCS